MSALEVEIEAERQHRLRRRAHGRAYHYWRERGDKEPPCNEYWCEHCAGYFGVPHDYAHEEGSFCRSMGRYPGNRQCACIDCVVFERVSV